MATFNRYKLGETYQTIEGKSVRIIEIIGECVVGDDDIARYDREGIYENGRVTGTRCYPPDVRNFLEGTWLLHPFMVATTMCGAMRGGESYDLSNKIDTRRGSERIAKTLDAMFDALPNSWQYIAK